MNLLDIISLAAVFGVIPPLVWLWLWLKEDKQNPEPWQYIMLTFLAGMSVVFVAIFFQLISIMNIWAFSPIFTVFIWAGIEEVLKFSAAYFVALRKKVNDEPIDAVIYLIVAALGFAALENTLYLMDPISKGLIVDGVVIANMRFLGSSLLHVVASATVGIFLAFAFNKSRTKKIFYGIIGLFLATVLHTGFNIQIILPEINFEIILFVLFVGALITLIVLERVKKVAIKERV